MEKYFIVTEKSSLREHYMAYSENKKQVRKLAEQFIKDNGIETSGYGLLGDILYIVPTENDKKKFANQLSKKVEDNGLVAFKKTSEIGKKWIKTLDDNNLKVLSKPFVPFYFMVYGRSRTRLFDWKDVVYCSIETIDPCESINTPEGFIEIKASEFYKVIEEIEEAEKEA